MIYKIVSSLRGISYGDYYIISAQYIKSLSLFLTINLELKTIEKIYRRKLYQINQ